MSFYIRKQEIFFHNFVYTYSIVYYFNCILLIDDDPINNLITEELLKQLYFSDRITTVLTAKEGLKFIHEFYLEHGCIPELILVDINMPEMDGFQFVEVLNNLPITDKETFRISALTSSSDSGDIQLMEELGVDHYMIKPLNYIKVKELLNAINQG